jgi:hypothetical protein
VHAFGVDPGQSWRRGSNGDEDDVTHFGPDNTQPAIFRGRVGAFEIISLLDSKVVRGGLSMSYGGGAAADDVGELARANLIDVDRYEHPFIPTLVNTGKLSL